MASGFALERRHALGRLLVTGGIADTVALTDGRERGYARGGGGSGAAAVEWRTLTGLHDGGAGASDRVSVGDVMANATGGAHAAVLQAAPAGMPVWSQLWPPTPAHVLAAISERRDTVDAERCVTGTCCRTPSAARTCIR
jgi:hypothetical protein